MTDDTPTPSRRALDVIGHSRSGAQVERLEVVDTGRRRRWSEDEKLKIVLESLQAPRQIAATARRYGVSYPSVEGRLV
ncbi:transposase-like protein [Bradyrhizobium sp. USDA 4532]|nr:transposase-like protein [Bradyrhizobium sp. USDA 4545]MCP1916523.1 transposase-like protein [Bradyrhizobium sp. USDA 4532]